ncbi:MAG: hypothetical protein QME76_06750 [Bacillota bacterium]|nr:hypothetical protein [Bacillota bacterium]
MLDQFVMPICFNEWNTDYFGLAFFGGWLAYVAVALLGVGLEWLSTRRQQSGSEAPRP